MKHWIVMTLVLLCHCSEPKDTPNQFTTGQLPWANTENTTGEIDWLQEKLIDARQKYIIEQYEVSLDAYDPGERLEHSTITQLAIDRGSFSNRDLFQFGDELFEYHFRPEDGWGSDRLDDGPTLRRVHREKKGGPDSFSCVDCHSKGGIYGASSISQNSYFSSDGNSHRNAQVRSAPHLLGLGAIEAVAAEMSNELQELRRSGIRTATTSGMAQNVVLESKGVRFGRLMIERDGVISESSLEGVRDDLIVRPFGWKGEFSTIREIVEHSFRVHLGITSSSFQEKIRDELINGADYGTGAWFDIDNDGVSVEVEDGMLTSVSVYLALLEMPVIRPPEDEVLLSQFSRGKQVFRELNCHQCHVPTLSLENTTLSFRPTQSVYANSATIEIDLATEGESPRLQKESSGDAFAVHLYSDLKIHDMGATFVAAQPSPTECTSCFRTPPLWGLSHSGPYLHDGKALTVDEAIRLHDGAAKSSRNEYEKIPPEEQAALQVFLLSLSRMPSVEVR
ncbi:MAG: di-heme oxidoredictase family protein [Myxococcota bacterium]|nr:di-heme oxidoredictase family protein [Myxococcota bacterium]